MCRKYFLLLLIIFLIIVLLSQTKEHFITPYQNKNGDKLEDGFYIITNRRNNNERCLISDNSAYPRLSEHNDRMCGYKSQTDLLRDGKAIWYVKHIKDGHYIIASGFDNFNKCLMFDNGGKGLYPIKFSWNYSSDSLCGVSGGISGFENSIGRSLWEITPIGGNKYTISNSSNYDISNNIKTQNVWAGGTPADTTSAPIVSGDINSPSPIAISKMSSIPIPTCLSIVDEDIPRRWTSYQNPSNQTTCGFNGFNELVNDGKSVWFFYKVEQ